MNELALKGNDNLMISVSSLESQFREMAIENIGEELKSYSGPEAMALVTLEALGMAQKVELAYILVKGKLISETATRNLHSHHPEKFSSYKEAAKRYGVSASQASDYKNWWETIVPYFLKNGIDVLGTWEEVGQSNLREITPSLMALITGEHSRSDKVNERIEAVYDDIYLTQENTKQELDEEEQKLLAVEVMLEHGKGTNTSLRQALSSTPPIDAYIVNRNGSMFLMAELSQDQLDMIYRRMDNKLSAQSIDLEKESAEAIPMLRRLLNG